MLRRIITGTGLPYWVFHIPLLPYYIYLSIRSGSLAFFTNTNPGFFLSGFVNVSKTEFLRFIRPGYLPASLYLNPPVTPETLREEVDRGGLRYPLIVKPDDGIRGKGVVRLSSSSDIADLWSGSGERVILQEFIDSPLEFGVLFYRFPISGKQGVSSVCLKEYPFISGNGTDNIETLSLTKYGHLNFENITPETSLIVPGNGEKFNLEYVAHRNRKCTFLDYNHLITPELIRTFGHISDSIEGFFFGRFDVKVDRIEDLISGHNLKVLEVNGVNGQPIHIFDPSYSLLKTYRDLYKHWHLIYRISDENTQLGVPRATTNQLLRAIILT